MILAKPHQQKSFFSCGELECQMVVPTISSASTCTKCWCTACLFAKAKKKSIESLIISDPVEVEGTLTNKDAKPGDKVSCTQYMSPTKEYLIHTNGKESSMEKLCCGAIFVDHATNHNFTNHQANLTVATIVESKHKY